MPEIFEGVAEAVATADTRGAWLREWRLLAIDGFEVDLPDTPANAGEFGYAGSGDNRPAFPKARVVALADTGAGLAHRGGDGAAVGEGSEVSVLPRAYQDLVEVAAGAGRPLRAGEFAAATGQSTAKAKVEGLRAKLKLLAARGWLAGVPGGLFTLPDHAGETPNPGQ
jgi:hypothetical protein